MMAALQQQVATIEPTDERDTQWYGAQSKHDWLQQLSDIKCQQISAQDRRNWMLSLRDHVNHAAYTLADYWLMLDLAVRLCDWVMAIDISSRVLNTDTKWLTDELNIEALLINAQAHVQLGYPYLAIKPLQCGLLKYYDNKRLLNDYYWTQEQDQQAQKNAYSWHNYHAGQLSLTPLARHHLGAFRWAYIKQHSSKSSVAEQCNLPNFNSDDEWFNWLHACQHYPNHYVYGVVHQEWGFIGSVCLEVFQGVGFFYYWLGQDFQGYGFGPQAVSILLNIGKAQKSMHCCYAKVYDHNQASQKALVKIGFTPLPMTLVAPYDNELLYYWGAEKNQHNHRNELTTLFVDMGEQYKLQVTRDALL